MQLGWNSLFKFLIIGVNLVAGVAVAIYAFSYASELNVAWSVIAGVVMMLGFVEFSLSSDQTTNNMKKQRRIDRIWPFIKHWIAIALVLGITRAVNFI